MMNQFIVRTYKGEKCLVLHSPYVDYDYFMGFYRIIKRLN